jgi:hypothetical protein
VVKSEVPVQKITPIQLKVPSVAAFSTESAVADIFAAEFKNNYRLAELQAQFKAQLTKVRATPIQCYEILLYRSTKEAKSGNDEPIVSLKSIEKAHRVFLLQSKKEDIDEGQRLLM